jgi:hypothetical protein
MYDRCYWAYFTEESVGLVYYISRDGLKIKYPADVGVDRIQDYPQE